MTNFIYILTNKVVSVMLYMTRKVVSMTRMICMEGTYGSHADDPGQKESELPKKLTLNKLALIGEAEKSP